MDVDEMLTSPMRIQQLLNLTQLGISRENLTGNVFMESDKYIYVREGRREKAQLVFIDMSKPTKVSRKPSDMVYYDRAHYDYVIVNLASRVLGRRVGDKLRILKLEPETTRETEIKAHTMGEVVVTWEWINKDKIAVVTETAVYHWSIEGDSEPVKVIDRLWHGEIMNYITHHSLKWLALINVTGFGDPFAIQFHSVDPKSCRLYKGFIATFTEFKLEHNIEPSILFCYVNASPPGSLSLHIIEVGEPAKGDRAYGEKIVDLCTLDDFPSSLHISQKFNIIYLVTCSGKVHLYDVESGDCIYSHLRSIGTPLRAVPHEATGGILVVNAEAKVLSVSIDDAKTLAYVISITKNCELSKRLVSRWNLTPDKIKDVQFHVTVNNLLTPPTVKLRY